MRSLDLSPPSSRVDLGVASLLFPAAVAHFSLTCMHSFELRDKGFLLRTGNRVAAGEIAHWAFIGVFAPEMHVTIGTAVWLFDGSFARIHLMLALIKGGAVVLTFPISRSPVTRPFCGLRCATCRGLREPEISGGTRATRPTPTGGTDKLLRPPRLPERSLYYD